MDIAVIGLGLIGGSTLRALARAGHQVLGYDADPATRATARTAAAKAPAGARWQVAPTVRDAVASAELVVVAVPLPAFEAVLHELGNSGYSGLVTDVTSVKGPVRDLVERRLHRLAGFVGGTRWPGGRPPASPPPTPTSSPAAPGCSAWSRRRPRSRTGWSWRR
ncbi:prephenate dehydrogenase/arogenate dehydrogenase family protein [Phytohabitans flavus]|uniref:prephenate dehydrogenase/arogenate dehydrogenase family protein n=1 Tax=Phytohabitans flavus TaxID=1076124 RepID=UPI002F969539